MVVLAGFSIFSTFWWIFFNFHKQKHQCVSVSYINISRQHLHHVADTAGELFRRAQKFAVSTVRAGSALPHGTQQAILVPR